LQITELTLLLTRTKRVCTLCTLSLSLCVCVVRGAAAQLLDKKRKLNIIDKSKLDWKKYKRDNKQVDEELQTYAKGGKTYTERQDFLKRTEMREYEIERDQRLNSSARTRGRL